MKKVIKSLLYSLLFVMTVACVREPPLHLHTGQPVITDMPIVALELDVFWNYDLELGYDWRAEWSYGWDDEDRRLFGEIGYTEPHAFDLRRYYLNQTMHAPHAEVESFDLYSTSFQARYKYGYYDLLVWNKIDTPDGVQSVIFDESTLDSVMVYTNNAQVRSPYDRDIHNSQALPKYSWGSPNYNYAFHMPEHVFSAYGRDIYISQNVADYDYYDPETHIYYKYLDMTLVPVTYIYLTQIRLHHNNGRIEGVDGNANISGMARGACVNSGLSAHDPITVTYNSRFKRNVEMVSPCNHVNHGIAGEQCKTVDIAGGRVVTFGIPNQNSSRVSRAEDVKDNVRHYLDMTLLFNNGFDSTFVFDVTDQVRHRYKGGVITIDIDVDTIPIPQRPGGSGFDAEVEDWNEENHEFDMSGKPRNPGTDSDNNQNNDTKHEKTYIDGSSCGYDARKLFQRRIPRH